MKIYHVDAFADRIFPGNPAAVCVLPEPKGEGWMQSLAGEMNLSETAFLVRRGDGFDLRWFTPVKEVDLCGHATLGSAYVISRYLEPNRRKMSFQTRSGRLTVTRDKEIYCLDLPAQPPKRIDDD